MGGGLRGLRHRELLGDGGIAPFVIVIVAARDVLGGIGRLLSYSVVGFEDDSRQPEQEHFIKNLKHSNRELNHRIEKGNARIKELEDSLQNERAWLYYHYYEVNRLLEENAAKDREIYILKRRSNTNGW